MSEQKKTYTELEQELREAREDNAILSSNLINVQSRCIEDMHNYIRALIWDCNHLRKRLGQYESTEGYDAFYGQMDKEAKDVKLAKEAIRKDPRQKTPRTKETKEPIESVKDYV